MEPICIRRDVPYQQWESAQLKAEQLIDERLHGQCEPWLRLTLLRAITPRQARAVMNDFQNGRACQLSEPVLDLHGINPAA
jgi:hypothetical protein